MDKRNDRSSPFGRCYQIDLTLPDGRTYLYANRPMQTPGEWAFNAWWRCNAFMERPYGQMLWVPGEDEEMLDYKQVFGNQFEIYNAPGTQRVLEYKIRHQLNTYLNGDIACLELENGENLLFDFYSGKLLERQNADGSQRLEFSELTSDGWTPIQNAFGGHDTQIKDKLGRQIVIRRDQNELVREIIDPRGRAVTYEYNNLSELTGVVNRLGERKVFRYKASPPHYLAAMDIRQQGSNNQLITQTINYDYTSEGRLSNMAVGDTAIRMDYREGAAGTGGTQTITDEATGGQSNVVYDAEGRVLQMDQGGVPTQYEYFNKADTIQEQPDDSRGHGQGDG
jgi:YD repeat-containing protein